MWRRMRGKDQSREMGEKRMEEREHLRMRTRLNLIQRALAKNKKGIVAEAKQQGNKGKKTEKVDDPSLGPSTRKNWTEEE